MKQTDLFAEKTTINISVVKLHNQKINKTIFNQLLNAPLFDRTFNLKDDAKILGFVNDKEKYILWGDGKSVYKCSLVRITNFARFDLNKGKVKDFLILYRERDIAYFNEPAYEREENLDLLGEYSVSHVLNSLEKEDILLKQDFINEFLLELNQRQVFL